MVTDSKRLQQVLKNLLSNAFKFTAAGRRAAERLRGGRRLDDRRIRSSARRRASSPSRCRTPASASRPRSSASSSRRSSRPTPAPAASTAAPASAWPSAASWRTCSAARSSCAAPRASAARSRSTCRCATSGRPSLGRGDGAARAARSTHDHAAAGRRARRSGRSRSVADDRDDLEPDDATLLIVEDDPHYARILVDLAHDHGLKVLVADARRRRAGAGAPVPADRGVARRVPARHARLDGAQPAEAGSRDAPHPGADGHARRGSPARPGARRVLVHHQADDHRGAGAAPSRASRPTPRPAASGCWSSRTTPPSS